MNAIRDLFCRAYLELRRAERTRALWANPLSIYGPDPQRLAVVMFNASIEESQVNRRARIEQLRRQIEAGRP